MGTVQALHWIHGDVGAVGTGWAVQERPQPIHAIIVEIPLIVAVRILEPVPDHPLGVQAQRRELSEELKQRRRVGYTLSVLLVPGHKKVLDDPFTVHNFYSRMVI